MLHPAYEPFSKNVWIQWAESILARFSREVDLPFGGASEGEPLKVLQREYPDLEALVRGKRVLDFGCGRGYQAAALATVYGCRVTGLDTNPNTLEYARSVNGKWSPRFIERLDDAQYDVVISLNAMEHFDDPATVLADMGRALLPAGKILITFGPPWFAPYGSHMHFFCKIPWLNLLFPEAAVMSVRSRYKHDGAHHYEEVESGLNKMSLAKFERLVRTSGLKIVRRHYTAAKRLNFLTRLPLIRELLTVHVTVILVKQ
jgi:SAM-dependent methyltransferase